MATDQELKLLKEKVQGKKAVIGTERVLKELKKGLLKKIFLAQNCPPTVTKDIVYYAHLAHVPVVTIDLTNEELGVFCKKNFFVSLLGLTEE